MLFKKNRYIAPVIQSFYKQFFMVFRECKKVIESLNIKDEEIFLDKVHVLMYEYFYNVVLENWSLDEHKNNIAYKKIFEFFKLNKKLAKLDQYGFRSIMIDRFERDPVFVSKVLMNFTEPMEIIQEFKRKKNMFDVSILEEENNKNV